MSFRLLLAASCLGLTGCGYTFGWMFPANVRSICVTTFRNDTFRREMEIPLTAAVVQEINAKTPLAIKRQEKADSTLEGTIVSVEEIPQVETRTDDVREEDVRVKVRITWYVNKTGERILDNEPVEHVEQFVLALGPDEEAATREVLRELAERIVNRMEAAGAEYQTLARRKGRRLDTYTTPAEPTFPETNP